jgi:hypothetical protein
MILLAINIPTFERFESFSEILIEVENDINSLNGPYKEMIELNIFDNNSSTQNSKNELCEIIRVRSNINIKFIANKVNIGGDKNIKNCCSANICANFTWVLGDDDHIIPGCIPKVISLLLNNRDNLGLIVLTGDYDCHPALRDKIFTTYEQFARLAINQQPHLLIAHTLISCNIFRTKIFDIDEAEYVYDKLTPRIGLIANFVHMRGLVKGLLNCSKEYIVLTPSFKSLDTSRRLPSDIDLGSQMSKIYYFYFLWLLVELGIYIDEVPRHDAMWWLFRDK